jgi:HSP20 family molecular chaperone IbpA
MATKQISVARSEQRASPTRELRNGRREEVRLRDLSECLLAAYEGVSRRALRLHQARGATPGSEVQEWKEAEHELLGAMPVDLAETEENFYALASVPGYAAAEISVAVEDYWLLISGYGHSFGEAEAAAGGVKCGGLSIAGPCGEVSAADTTVENNTQTPLRCGPGAEQSLEDCVVRRPFCVVELGRKVDASRSTAVVANGMVAVRMAKANSEAPIRDKKVQE